MADLNVLLDYKKSAGSLPTRGKQMATACMVGIIFHNQFAGRTRQWERMKTHAMKAFLKTVGDHLEFQDYKTSDEYGPYT